jgi:hypothetical protein
MSRLLMKTLLTIGYEHFILPASVNVNGLLAALQKAQPVDDKWVDNQKVYIRKDCEVTIEVKLVQDSCFIDSKKLKALPENASPDAHNTF